MSSVAEGVLHFISTPGFVWAAQLNVLNALPELSQSKVVAFPRRAEALSDLRKVSVEVLQLLSKHTCIANSDQHSLLNCLLSWYWNEYLCLVRWLLTLIYVGFSMEQC